MSRLLAAAVMASFWALDRCGSAPANGVQRFAYEAEANGRHIVVFDHKPAGREYDKSDLPVFSPDGRRTAYAHLRSIRRTKTAIGARVQDESFHVLPVEPINGIPGAGTEAGVGVFEGAVQGRERDVTTPRYELES